VHGGRWNPPDSFATLCLALSRATAVAEFHRLARRQLRHPEDFLPRRPYRFDVALNSVLDLRQSGARAEVSLTDAYLTADDPATSRSAGEAAQYLGLEGIPRAIHHWSDLSRARDEVPPLIGLSASPCWFLQMESGRRRPPYSFDAEAHRRP